MTISRRAPVERVAFSITEFCQAVGISRTHFYALPAEQRPRMVACGQRWLIPAEAVRDWLNRSSQAAA
ncbi:MAG: excisionase family DNA-binding protein [Variibacter sp.]